MGAISSTINHFSKEDKIFIAEHLRKVYDDSVAQGKNDREIQLICEQEFNKIVSKRINHNGSSEEISSVKPNSVVVVKDKKGGNQNNVKTSGKKEPIVSDDKRRKSFENLKEANNGANKSDKAAKTVVEHKSTIQHSESRSGKADNPKDADSWDSVTSQPFCDCCKMAFKTSILLDRHVKFSKSHAKNLRKPRAKELAILVPKPDDKNEENVDSKVVMQVEGIHFRLLYSGAKFFWRTQTSVDFDIFHHFLTYTIEIIPYNSTKSFEMDRLYLNYDEAVRTVSPLIDDEVEKQLEEIAKDRFAEKPDESKLREEVLVQKLVTFMLQRLNLESSAGLQREKCIFMTLYGESHEKPLLLPVAPLVLFPISVPRQHKSTVEEINAVVQGVMDGGHYLDDDLDAVENSLFKTEQSLIKKKNPDEASFAVRVANLVYDGANFLMNIERYSKENRWKWAVRRVIDRLRIRKFRAFLTSKGIPYGKKEITFKVVSHIVPSDRFHPHHHDGMRSHSQDADAHHVDAHHADAHHADAHHADAHHHTATNSAEHRTQSKSNSNIHAK